MKVLYYDCFSGISGDMNLGAMLDLGVEPDFLREELKKLNIEDEYKLEIYKDSRKGIAGTKVDVIVYEHDDYGHKHGENHQHEHEHENEHEHEHEHEHGYEQHYHDHDHFHIHKQEDKEESHHHHDRNLESIENLINRSSLNDNIKRLSLKIFMKIAEAEAKVHGKDLYEVHFHEVGAVDSIIDIVGAAICLDYLDIARIMCSTVELGGGFVKCAHGLIPVPAPATLEILTGVPVKSGAVPFETTTPTGAAILAAVVDKFTDNKNFIIKKVAYGVGGRDTEIPNVLRVIMGETLEKKNVNVEEFSILETNIDDMNPEFYEYVMDRAFEAGALDVFLTPIIMKKTRPAVMLSALCREKDEDSIKAVIFKETSTLGIRKYSVDRECLDRDFEKINTQYGEVTVKNSYFNGVQIKSKPEYEDCKKIALEKGIPVKAVYEEVFKSKN